MFPARLPSTRPDEITRRSQKSKRAVLTGAAQTIVNSPFQWSQNSIIGTITLGKKLAVDLCEPFKYNNSRRINSAITIIYIRVLQKRG